MPENGTIAYIAKPKECDFCKLLADRATRATETVDIKQAQYDFRTKTGQWANACSVHWIEHRMYPTLGIGKGQKLELYPTQGESDPAGQS